MGLTSSNPEKAGGQLLNTNDTSLKANNVVRFSTSARSCPVVPMEKLAPELHSQQQEDKTLLQWFNGLCNGTYIEMGALDGLRYSNTYMFNQVFHWRGVLIELSPPNYNKLVKNRPNEIATVHAAVCANKGTVHWYKSGATTTSGIWEFTAESYRKQWWKNATFNDTIPIECSPLRDILEKHAPTHSFFDVFTLDVEGAELEVLQSLDFEKVGFGMIVVENDGHDARKDKAVRTLLEANGYRYLQRLGNNDIMVNKEFDSIYMNLVAPTGSGNMTEKSDGTIIKVNDATLKAGGMAIPIVKNNISPKPPKETSPTCIPSCNCTNQKYFKRKTDHTLEDLYEIDLIPPTKNSSEMQAVCVWNGKKVNAHLPHWLELVYRCWSWWDLHKDTHRAVLEVPTESQMHWDRAQRSPLAEGLWRQIRDALSVIVVSEPRDGSAAQYSGKRRATPIKSNGWTLNDDLRMPWFATVETAHSLRDYVVGKTFPGRPLSGCGADLRQLTVSQKCSARIGILDRLGSRQLLNHEEIFAALQGLVSTPVSYKTFEGASFEEQIDFYSSIDILVTPHGAQLSGAPFMPSCGAVLELLPKSYHCQFFFGSLISSANLTSSYLYLSDGDPQKEIWTSRSERVAARKGALCPPVSSIVSSVRSLIDKWEQCVH